MSSSKLYKFIKEEKGLFDGGHNVYTPETVINPILDNVSGKDFLILYNIEFAISLIYNKNIDPTHIFFFSDHENKNKIAQRLKINFFNNLEEIKMKNRPVLLTNPPYTNGEQDASEIYTDIINSCIDKFNPVAIGGVTPESLINGGQKKASLRKKILDKYGFKSLTFLNQKRDWQEKIKVDTISFVFEENYSGDLKIVSRHHNSPFIVKEKLTEYIDGYTQSIYDWILKSQTTNKINLKTGKKTSQSGIQLKISKDGIDNALTETGDLYDSDNTEWRVAFGYMRCNTCAIVKPGISIPSKYRYLNFGNNETLARNFASYVLSEPIRFILKLTYTSRTLDNPQLSYVPNIDLSQFKTINDQVLYNFWNVDKQSQKEISIVIKDEIPF